MRRPLRVLLEVCGVLLAGLVVAIVAVAWRLTSGPVDVDVLAPYVEDAFRDGPARLEIGGTAIRWSGFDRPFSLTARAVRVLGADGTAVATLPELALDLSVTELLHGRFVPTRLELVRPELRVIRTAEGGFSFGLGGGDGGEAVRSLLEALGQPPGAAAGHPLAALTRFGVIDGRVTVEDRQLGLVWELPDADIDLQRRADGITGRLALQVLLGEQVVRQTASLFYSYRTGETDATLAFAGLVPAALAAQHPRLAPLAALNSPLGGTVSLHLDAGFRPRRADFDLQGGPGRIVLDGRLPEPLAVAGLALSGAVNVPARAVTIDRAAIDLGGPRLEGVASLVEAASGIEVIAQASLTDLPVDRLDRLWPHDLSANARRWVTGNLSHGTVRHARALVQGRLPAGPAAGNGGEEMGGDGIGGATLRSLGGEIVFEGVTVNFLEGMPPVTGVTGTATFDASGFRIATTGGQLLDLAVPQAVVAIAGLDQAQETIDIEAVISGPVRTVLTVIDRPPLGYARTVGLDPAAATGEMAGRLRFAFPLLNALALDQVRLAAAANLRDAALGRIIGGLEVSGIDAALELDGRGMGMRGEAALNGVPVTFDWSERFAHDRDERTRLTVAGTLDDAARTALGLPELAWLSGEVPVEAVYADRGRGRQTVTAELDLEPAGLEIDPLDWEKPPGVPGSAGFVLELNGGTPVRLSRFNVAAAGLRAAGSVDLADGTTVRTVELNDFAQGYNRFSARISRLDGGGYAIEARGASLDLRPVLDDAFDSGGHEAAASGASAPSGAADPSPPGLPLRITVAFGVVVLGEERALFNVEGSLANDGTDWHSVDLSARAGETGTVRVQYRPSGDGGATLSVRAEDAGAALHAFDLMPTVRGGRLSIEAARRGAPDAPLTGSAMLEEFRLVRAPILARLLAALSLGGLQDLLTTDGIAFSHLSSDFTLHDRLLTLRDARIAGDALGATADGLIDLRQERIDVAGMIVPIYTVNRIIGAIPLLGDLLTGGEGQGLIAFTYRATGPLDDPSVAVNPLSVLAPGALRNLFLARPGSGGTASPPAAAVPAGGPLPQSAGGGG